MTNYSTTYGIDSLSSVGVDDGYNVWLLDGSRIGVLKPGSKAPVWTSNVGQAGLGFNSTVICGGTEGRAYVGYETTDLDNPGQATPDQKLQGDSDIVKLGSNGAVALDQHLMINNTNDPTYDETRTILSCAKVMRGEQKGDLYFGTNHAVTRVRGALYADHRHSVFDEPTGSGHLVVGYNWAVSITQDGNVFLANEYKFGIIAPHPELAWWLNEASSPWLVDSSVDAIGPETFSQPQSWRATAQRTDGVYFLGSAKFGLWRMQIAPRAYAKVAGLPTEQITALAATDDGTLYIGTGDSGLWTLGPDETLAPFAQVEGSQVLQLVSDPTTAPWTLYAVTEKGLFVLRGEKRK